MNTAAAVDWGSRARLARAVTLACYGLLIVMLSAELFSIASLLPRTRMFLWCICVVPLLLFLPGMLRGAWKTFLWLCFMLPFYFALSVARLADAQPDLAARVELLMVCLLFVASMLYARWRQRELALAANRLEGETGT